MINLIEKKTDQLKNTIINNNNIISDFIFICYFLGNDFIAHIPSIDIKINGIDILISTYIETFIELGCNSLSAKGGDMYNTLGPTFLVNKHLILNDIFLEIFIKKLVQKENNFFIYDLQKYKHVLTKKDVLKHQNMI